MRQIVLDTETTGLDPKQGHRIIELAGIEVVNRRATGRMVQFHVDPGREIDAGATVVHGKTWDDLKGKPKFGDIAAEFLEFARGAEWIIHNAPFDVAFLDVEFGLAGHSASAATYGKLTDTLALAREMFPGKRNGLDALCERFGIDNAHRTLHGALLDAELLAEVWLAMTRGQESLTMDLGAPPRRADGVPADGLAPGSTGRGGPLLVVEPTADELAAHVDYLAVLDKETKGRCAWLVLEPARGAG
ncbi:MAG: DNA polymerase III subunit epsilon [Casimicrobiaceae bacterium]